MGNSLRKQPFWQRANKKKSSSSYFRKKILKIWKLRRPNKVGRCWPGCTPLLLSAGLSLWQRQVLKRKDCGLWSQEPPGLKSQLYHFQLWDLRTAPNLSETHFPHQQCGCNKSHIRVSGNTTQSDTPGADPKLPDSKSMDRTWKMPPRRENSPAPGEHILSLTDTTCPWARGKVSVGILKSPQERRCEEGRGGGAGDETLF